MRALNKVGGTEVENFAIGVVKGSVFRSETYVVCSLINVFMLLFPLVLNLEVFYWIRMGECYKDRTICGF